MKISTVWPVVALGLLAPSCKKYSIPQNVASVLVVNAMPLGSPVIPVFGEGPALYYVNANAISYGNYYSYTTNGGDVFLHATTVADTTTDIYAAHLPLVNTGTYSLFFYGIGKVPGVLLTRDTIPVIPVGDSSAAIRFVNLSPDSQGFSIDIAGNAQPELTNLGYGQADAFKEYSTATAAGGLGGSYTFEIRDQASGALLLTYQWEYLQYHTNTVVLSGSSMGSFPAPLTAILINHY